MLIILDWCGDFKAALAIGDSDGGIGGVGTIGVAWYKVGGAGIVSALL